MLVVALAFSACASVALFGIVIWKTKSAISITTAPFSAAETQLAENSDSPELSETKISAMANLFGLALTDSASESIDSIPETPLNLRLVGTFSHSDASLASALVASDNSETRRYFLDQEIGEQALLSQVGEGYIVIVRNGQEELLKLPMLSGAPIGPEMSYPESITSDTSENSNLSSSNPTISTPEADTTSLRDRLNALRNR